jgi:hypothetical protein
MTTNAMKIIETPRAHTTATAHRPAKARFSKP